MPVAKKLISLRLDTDTIEWFKAQGPGYQTRMNAVLRAFVQHQRRIETAALKVVQAEKLWELEFEMERDETERELEAEAENDRITL